MNKLSQSQSEPQLPGSGASLTFQVTVHLHPLHMEGGRFTKCMNFHLQPIRIHIPPFSFTNWVKQNGLLLSLSFEFFVFKIEEAVVNVFLEQIVKFDVDSQLKRLRVKPVSKKYLINNCWCVCLYVGSSRIMPGFEETCDYSSGLLSILIEGHHQ